MWIIESILLAIAMAMDAFAVSITNGLSEPNMKKRKVLAIAITFGVFQGLMPLIGFLVGSLFEKWITFFVPIIGFVILTYLGINMIKGALKCECEECKPIIGFKALLLQGIATSIDALAVLRTREHSAHQDTIFAYGFKNFEHDSMVLVVI